MVLPAESKSASMRNGVSRLEYITNPEPLQIGNDFQTRIFKEFLHMFSRESRALARVCSWRNAKGDITTTMSKIAAGFEIRAIGALELAFLFIKLRSTVWASAFEFFEIDRITSAGRHAVCHPVVRCRSIRQGG